MSSPPTMPAGPAASPKCQQALPHSKLPWVPISSYLHTKEWFAQLNICRNWVASRVRDSPKAGVSGGFGVRIWIYGSPFSALGLRSASPQCRVGYWNELKVFSGSRYSHPTPDSKNKNLQSIPMYIRHRETQLNIMRATGI